VRRLREAGHGLTLAVAILAGVLSAASTTAAQVRRPANRPPAPRAVRHAPLKAIFEPVYYPLDVDISDVFFVDDEIGWAAGHHPSAAGDGGFIIVTRDGGKTWALQFGDRNAGTGAITRLFFVDATHGWAQQVDGTLLRTTDGTNWMAAGRVDPLSQIVFITADKGFFLRPGQGVQATVDGGRSWRLAYLCDPQAIAFAPDQTTGYAIARAPGRTAVVLRTTDAGERWSTVALLPETNVNDVSLAFSDALTGYLRAGAAIKKTSDGGHSWHGVAAKVPTDTSKLAVAGPVAWMIGSHDFNYTLDGIRWFERRMDFPSYVIGFSLVSPDTGYIAGCHGMIYRYRVVPFDYTVPGMLVIPGMSTFVADGS
jgi:hypothetical protein